VVAGSGVEKVRVGFGLGTHTATNDQERFGGLVDDLDRLGFDSLWVSERIGADAADPLVAMAFAAGRAPRLKFGMSVMVLPGRSPVLVAKALASLDRISDGRLLPAFGLGVADPREQQAFAIGRKERAAVFDEALGLVRRLWQGDEVDHHGPHFSYEGVRVRPRPVQDPLEVWLGGRAPGELRRVGRTGDGWLPSFCDAEDVRTGIEAVDRAADDAGRSIDRGHFGALIAYSQGDIPAPFVDAIRQRRPDIDDPRQIIPQGHTGLRDRIEEMVEAGATKFVVVPMVEPERWTPELESLAEAVLPLQT
jgi:probable F420-dependent oxidoreductase